MSLKARLTDAGPLVFTVVLVNSERCKQPTCPSVGEQMCPLSGILVSLNRQSDTWVSLQDKVKGNNSVGQILHGSTERTHLGSQICRHEVIAVHWERVVRRRQLLVGKPRVYLRTVHRSGAGWW